MAGFEVTMHGRFCTDPRGGSRTESLRIITPPSSTARKCCAAGRVRVLSCQKPIQASRELQRGCVRPNEQLDQTLYQSCLPRRLGYRDMSRFFARPCVNQKMNWSIAIGNNGVEKVISAAQIA